MTRRHDASARVGCDATTANLNGDFSSCPAVLSTEAIVDTVRILHKADCLLAFGMYRDRNIRSWVPQIGSITSQIPVSRPGAWPSSLSDSISSFLDAPRLLSSTTWSKQPDGEMMMRAAKHSNEQKLIKADLGVVQCCTKPVHRLDEEFP